MGFGPTKTKSRRYPDGKTMEKNITKKAGL
jgi:hypothetical protein